jgi:hypothetical protein
MSRHGLRGIYVLEEIDDVLTFCLDLPNTGFTIFRSGQSPLSPLCSHQSATVAASRLVKIAIGALAV